MAGHVVTLIVSAYCLCAGINGSGITATGKPLAQGMAACGRGYAFGTVFEIVGPLTPGMSRITECQDRGGAITDQHLDVAIVSADPRDDRRARSRGGVGACRCACGPAWTPTAPPIRCGTVVCKMDANNLIYASIFTGGGLADVGAQSAGYSLKWGIEREPRVAEWAVRNLGHEVIVSDVALIDPRKLERVDVLWASPPCQHYSEARKTATTAHPDADAGECIPHFLSALRPRAFVMENVRDYQHAPIFKRIVRTLFDLDYWVHVAVLNAADFGVPQTRKRLILRAVRGGFVPQMPEPLPWVSWGRALEGTPPGHETTWAEWQLLAEPRLNDPDFDNILVNSQNSRHVKQGDAPHAPSKSNLTIRHITQPAYTVMASMHAGHSRTKIDGVVRNLTPRQIARLQSVPDWYDLPENPPLARHILGNGVPCLLAETLLRGIGEVLQ